MSIKYECDLCGSAKLLSLDVNTVKVDIITSVFKVKYSKVFHVCNKCQEGFDMEDMFRSYRKSDRGQPCCT